MREAINIVRQFLAISLPARILAGILVGVIAGPGLIGFVSEYAAYKYALTIGIRPPVEGIPYLAATVTIISLLLAVAAFFVFLFSRFIAAIGAEMALQLVGGIMNSYIDSAKLFKKVTGYVKRGDWPAEQEWWGHERTTRSIRQLGPPSALILSAFIAATIGALAHWWARHVPPLDGEIFGLSVGVFVFTAILTVWSNKAKWVVAVLSVVMFYATSFTLLFDSQNYAKLLRILGYGGGVPVKVSLKTMPTKDHHVFLLLRTTQAILCLTEDKNVVLEVPLDNLDKMEFSRVPSSGESLLISRGKGAGLN